MLGSPLTWPTRSRGGFSHQSISPRRSAADAENGSKGLLPARASVPRQPKASPPPRFSADRVVSYWLFPKRANREANFPEPRGAMQRARYSNTFHFHLE